MLQAEQDLLVMAAQNGNRKALVVLVKHFQLPLQRFAAKLANNEELAKDALQEAWIEITAKLHRLQDPRAFRSWIYRMVRWRVVDAQRKNQRQMNQHQELDEDALEVVQQSDDSNEMLSLAINRLPQVEREIIHLFYLDDMTLIEISIVLDVPVGTVKSRLHRARKLLKQKFNY